FAACKAIAARGAPAPIIERVRFIESLRAFLEGRAPPRHFEHRPHRLRRVGIIPGVEVLEGGDLVSRCRLVSAAAQPGIDVTRRLLAVADGDREGAVGGHPIAARENTGASGHHIRSDPDHAMLYPEALHSAD